jgi:hypothetical protein
MRFWSPEWCEARSSRPGRSGNGSHRTRQRLCQRTCLLDLGRDRPGRRATNNPKRGRRQRLFARPVRSRRRVWSRVGLRRLLHNDGRSVAGAWARGGCSRLFVRPLLPAGGPVWRGRRSRSAVLRRRQSRRARHALVVDGEAQSDDRLDDTARRPGRWLRPRRALFLRSPFVTSHLQSEPVRASLAPSVVASSGSDP